MLLLLCACSSIDCPLNNMVYSNYVFKKADGTADTLADTLTVTAIRNDGIDTVVFNKGVGLTSFSVPMSYVYDEDALRLTFTDTLGNTTTDEIRVTKENHTHLESIDCAPRYFHTITGIVYTTNRIDSITLQNAEADYDTSKEHFHVYLSDN